MAAFYNGDQINAVVLDIGAANTKMGWAGDDAPRSLFRSNVACRRDESGKIEHSDVKYDYFSKPIVSDGTDGDWLPCNPIDPSTGLLYDPQICRSDNSNEITHASPDWYDLLQIFVNHGYNTALRGSTAKDHPLVLAERSYNTPAIRQQTLECLFEELEVPATFLSKDAVLSCYGCGRTSATVVDMGFSGATITPVVDGYVEQKGIRRNPGASIQAMDEQILVNLDKLYQKKKRQKNTHTVAALYQISGTGKKRLAPFHTRARMDMASSCRRHGAGGSINTTPVVANGGAVATATTTFHAPAMPFELPDGTVLDIPSTERFRAADLLYGGSSADSIVQGSRDAWLETTKANIEEYIKASALPEGLDEKESMQLENEAGGLSTGGTVKGNKSKRGGTVTLLRQNTPRTTAPKRSAAAWVRASNTGLQQLLDEQLTSSPLAAMICDAAYRSDRDQQATLLGNVILGGGGSCLGPTENAVPDKIKESVEALVHLHTPGWRVKVLTPAVNERAILPWIGGSILGSLGSFHEMYITKAEYEEWGSSIVNRKCP